MYLTSSVTDSDTKYEEVSEVLCTRLDNRKLKAGLEWVIDWII